MPRNKCIRHVDFDTKSAYFMPRGLPMNYLKEIDLETDEFEAIRLPDLHGLYQERPLSEWEYPDKHLGAYWNLHIKRLQMHSSRARLLK